MSIPEQPLPNTSVCPRCGAGLRCGMLAGDAECWCVQLPNIMPVPAAPGALSKNSQKVTAAATLPLDETPPAASCLCPACLKQITDVSIRAPFEANLEEVVSPPNKFHPPEGGGFNSEPVPDEQHNKL